MSFKSLFDKAFSSTYLRRETKNKPPRFSKGTIAIFLMLLIPSAFSEEMPDRTVQTILHMLDYVSVDYGGAVLYGKVLNDSEFKEQVEFAKQSAKLLGSLPELQQNAELIGKAQELASSVQAVAPPEQVRAAAQQLRRAIIAVYQVPVSPKRIPEFSRALILYQQLCVSCHGREGYGDGPDSNNINPKPANFHNGGRMGQRSIYGLFNAITLGVTGTAMRGFPQLSDEERWDLAFMVSNFRTTVVRLEQGRKLWESRHYLGPTPDMTTLTMLTGNEIGVRYGDDTKTVYDYLRAEPEALMAVRHDTLTFANEQLDMTLRHYRDGDHAGAQRYAIAAYLEGFEPLEVGLSNLDSQLRREIELAMMEVRQLVNTGENHEKLAHQINYTRVLLSRADELLRAGKLSASGAFASAFFILLREGLEAILILAAVITFVVKSGQRGALRYIHAGWGAALVLGCLTWVVATWLVDISGANREMTSGITALIASAMLIYVGFWLHDKSHAQAWQKFLHEKIGIALEKNTLWALALISFFAIYREIFETVLFYQALWTQSNDATRPALLSGMTSAFFALLITGWGLYKLGIKLPLGLFFSGASILFAIMAVIFAGQGVAALQEAGIVSTNTVDFISLPMLGVVPTAQTLFAQLLVISVVILCYLIPSRQKST